nr:MAG TPA: Radical SAM superfamily [Caudoviricetes sp.]
MPIVKFRCTFFCDFCTPNEKRLIRVQTVFNHRSTSTKLSFLS